MLSIPAAYAPHGAPAAEVYGNGRVAKALFPLLRRARIPLWRVHDSQGLRYTGPRGDGRTVVVDCTGPRYDGPEVEAWIRHLEERLRAGDDLVTCNKAPLALAWQRLQDAARAGGASIHAAATVGGGTPILPLLRRLGSGHEATALTASLSGTLAYVLGQVADGALLPKAVASAQALGFAEPDPTLDLDGTDALAKGVILHNLLWPGAPPLTLADVPERLTIDEAAVRAIAAAGGSPHAVVHVTPGEVRIAVEDAPWIDAVGGSAAVRLDTRGGATYTLAGPGAGPDVTAANLLADLLEVPWASAPPARPASWSAAGARPVAAWA